MSAAPLTDPSEAERAAAWAAYYAANPQYADPHYAYYGYTAQQQQHQPWQPDYKQPAAAPPATDAASAAAPGTDAAVPASAAAVEAGASEEGGGVATEAPAAAAAPLSSANVAFAGAPTTRLAYPGYGYAPHPAYPTYPGAPPAYPYTSPYVAVPPAFAVAGPAALPYGYAPPPSTPTPAMVPPPYGPGFPGDNPAHPLMQPPPTNAGPVAPAEPDKLPPQPGQEEFYRRPDNWPGRGYLVRYVGEAIHRAQNTPLNIRHDQIIERRVIGRLLGKGGRDLEAMQLCSGSQIFIIDKYPPPDEGDDHRLLVIIGKPDQVRLAKEKCEQVLARAKEELPPLPPPLTSGWRPVPTVGDAGEEGGQGWVSLPAGSARRPREDEPTLGPAAVGGYERPPEGRQEIGPMMGPGPGSRPTAPPPGPSVGPTPPPPPPLPSMGPDGPSPRHQFKESEAPPRSYDPSLYYDDRYDEPRQYEREPPPAPYGARERGGGGERARERAPYGARERGGGGARERERDDYRDRQDDRRRGYDERPRYDR